MADEDRRSRTPVDPLVQDCVDGGEAAAIELNQPAGARGELDDLRLVPAGLERVASFSNVACKLSGLSTEAPPGWWELAVQSYLKHALDVFGAQRCMIGSDWPVASLRTTMERWFDVVLELVAGLSAADRDAVLRGTATAAYGLSPPTPAPPVAAELKQEGLLRPDHLHGPTG